MSLTIVFDSVEYKSERAVLFIIGGKEQWIPYYLIRNKKTFEFTGKVKVTEWFVLDNDLERYTEEYAELYKVF
jgi:hypothetical protein